MNGVPKAEADDAVFGASFSAYRVEALATLIDFGVAAPLGPASAAQLLFSRFQARAYGGDSYVDDRLFASWQYRF